MKYLTLFLLMFSFSVNASKGNKVNFNQEQITTLQKSYDYGKRYNHSKLDLKWILPALAWKESGAGRIKYNKNKTAFGEFHNLAKIVYNREKQRNIQPSLPNFEHFDNNSMDLLEEFYKAQKHVNKQNRTKHENIKYISYRLTHDFDYAAYNAIQELETWYVYHKGDQNKMFASYFAGYGYKKSIAINYANDLQRKIRYLKQSGILDDKQDPDSGVVTVNN